MIKERASTFLRSVFPCPRAPRMNERVGMGKNKLGLIRRLSLRGTAY